MELQVIKESESQVLRATQSLTAITNSTRNLALGLDSGNVRDLLLTLCLDLDDEISELFSASTAIQRQVEGENKKNR